MLFMNPVYSKAQYSGSAFTLDQLPPDQGIEIAFAGRSNAGKSSAINVITGVRQLARVSRTPGRTQMINHFAIAPDRFLVDLPGYGYAKVSATTQRHWQEVLQNYLASRQALKGLILVMDVRHPLQPPDRQMIEWCADTDLGLHILLTKSDKISRNAANKALNETLTILEDAGIEASLQLFSALNKTGLDDVHGVLDEWFGFKNTAGPG
jgi:GTP-binding protein